VERVRAEFESSPAKCQALLAGLPYLQKGFCRLCLLKPNKEGGYVQLSAEGANKFAMLQEVLVWSRGVTERVLGEQCSHLCGNPLCLVAEHIIMESAKDNNNRKGCLVVGDCAHCPLKYLLCRHQPSCIITVDGFASWEAFCENGIHNL